MNDGHFYFAGTSSKLTKHGNLRMPALKKILRSGKVRVVTKQCHHDDTCVDYDQGNEVDPVELAHEIETDGSTGWRAYPIEGGEIRVCNHTFRSLTVQLMDVPPEIKAEQEAIKAKLKAQAARAKAREEERQAAEHARRAEILGERAQELGAEINDIQTLIAIKEAQALRDAGVQFN